MNNIQADFMWEDRPEAYSKQSWSDFNDVIVLSEPDFSTCAPSRGQQAFDFQLMDQGNEVFEQCQSPLGPRSRHISLPSMCNSPVLDSSSEMSPDPIPGYPPSYASSSAPSTFDDIKIDTQKHQSRSSVRRRDQNRAAQRAFRERREQHLRTLEARVHSAEESHRELQLSYQKLESIHKDAQRTIERQTIELEIFRSIVKCGYRPCEFTEGGERKSCATSATLRKKSNSNSESDVKDEEAIASREL